MGKQSPSKKTNNKKSSPIQKKKTSEKKRSRQGKLDMTNPFAKVTIYDTESELEESGKDYSTSSSDEEDIRIVSASSQVEQDAQDSIIGKSGQNILSAALRNRNILEHQDFLEIISWKQKGGSKGLKGKDLKRFNLLKSQMLCISKLCLAGAHLEKMKVFLNSAFFHLNQNAEYVAISSEIVDFICYLLQNVAVMENVDSGTMADYFNRRFADLRNRKNYNEK